jgi:NAD(P)H-dependent flavin oxidoreductase YrpB (nitropropane dioxygenase family)
MGIEYPIWSAGFGGAGPELAAAVSGAGGFGVLGANGLAADAIAALVARTQELTDQPFGLNLIIGEADEADREALLTAEVRAAADAQVAAVGLFWGDPAPMSPWPMQLG